MSLRHLLALSTLGLALGVASTSAQDDAKSTPLFNGKDLTGWTAVLDRPDAKMEDVWSVSDGILHCKGRPIGYLRTVKDDYRDYVLTLEWRWPEGAKGGNNGVLVHASKPGALGIWPRSLEVQLAQDNAGDFWVIPEDFRITIPNQAERQKGRRHLNLTDGSEKPTGQWNTYEITCKGDTIQVKVNGQLVNEATGLSDSQGAICLQSEGAPVDFRNIRIRSLDK